MKKITVTALTALLLLGVSIVQAYVPSGYLIVPGDHAGVVGDNDITVTATALEAGYQYGIKLEVSYHPNPRTPPADGASPPAGYTEWVDFVSDGSDVTHTFTVPLPDCHWQITAMFTLYYFRSDEVWVWNGDERGTAGVDIWSDCGPPPPPPPPPDGEGCTPGFWKNPKRVGLWPLSPGDDFDDTFGVDLFDPNITLGQAIKLGGGGVKKLARHGTAALLNAAHPDVAYPLTVDEVIAAVQAGDADTLVGYNELLAPGFCD